MFDVLALSQAQLETRLGHARAQGTRAKLIRAISRVDPLLIHDLGLKPLRAPSDEDLHEIIDECYERGATIDGLRRRAYQLTLESKSWRAPRSSEAVSTPRRTHVSSGFGAHRVCSWECIRVPRSSDHAPARIIGPLSTHNRHPAGAFITRKRSFAADPIGGGGRPAIDAGAAGIKCAQKPARVDAACAESLLQSLNAYVSGGSAFTLARFRTTASSRRFPTLLRANVLPIRGRNADGPR